MPVSLQVCSVSQLDEAAQDPVECCIGIFIAACGQHPERLGLAQQLQAEQIEAYRAAWQAAGWERTPRVSVSRSVIPITSDLDMLYFGHEGDQDQVGSLDGRTSRFGRTYTGEPHVIAEQLAADRAVQVADTLLLTVPNQLGVEYNARLLDTIARDVAPALGWVAKGRPAPR